LPRKFFAHGNSFNKEGLTLDALADQFSLFLDEAHRLKAKYTGKINLLVGLETEYISPIDLDQLENILARHSGKIEYMVGSVHHVNEIPIDFDRPTYQRALASFATHETDENAQRKQMTAFLSSYFDAQYELMVRFKPEVIGHVDLCRLYEPSLRFVDYPEAYTKLQRNVLFATEYGAAFELNAAAFRKGWQDAYPAEDVVAVSDY
jgi:histidinol-phosphatase (PHP family)